MPLPFLSGLAGRAGDYVVNLPASITASQTTVSPTPATANIIFNRDGTYSINGVGQGDWVAPKYAAVGDLFDVKLDYTGGTSPTVEAAADDTYIQISASRTWQNDQAVLGIKTTTGVIYIRRTGAGAALDSCTFEITAEVTV